MKTLLLCGIAVASVLMLQPAPASAQRAHGAGHAHMGLGHGYAGHGAARFHGGYARGYGTGYDVGAGAAALATGALIGGAIASQNQGYYYPDQSYPGYSDPRYGYSERAPEFWGEVQPPASLKGFDIPSRRAVFVPWKPSRRRGFGMGNPTFR
jgi:hypothetical protein